MDVGAVLGAGMLGSNLDIAPKALGPTKGDAFPPNACRHLPGEPTPIGAVFGEGVTDREAAFACPAAGVEGAR